MRPLHPGDLSPLPHRSTLAGRAVLPEHALAALTLLDVDDCDLRFWDNEAPILDGSALPIVRGLLRAGIAGPRLRAGLRVAVTIGGASVAWQGGLAPALARTFVSARFAGAARATWPGATPGCALVLGDPPVSSRYGGRPRLPNEPATHKLLDLLGDLGAWRARGRLVGQLCSSSPSHVDNPGTIARALDEGELRWTA